MPFFLLHLRKHRAMVFKGKRAEQRRRLYKKLLLEYAPNLQEDAIFQYCVGNLAVIIDDIDQLQQQIDNEGYTLEEVGSQGQVKTKPHPLASILMSKQQMLTREAAKLLQMARAGKEIKDGPNTQLIA